MSSDQSKTDMGKVVVVNGVTIRNSNNKYILTNVPNQLLQHVFEADVPDIVLACEISDIEEMAYESMKIRIQKEDGGRIRKLANSRLQGRTLDGSAMEMIYSRLFSTENICSFKAVLGTIKAKAKCTSTVQLVQPNNITFTSANVNVATLTVEIHVEIK
jgi:hypothetical protein